MLTLYFSPGACSLASHIGLEETGAPYEAKPILLAKQQQKTEAYLKINPRGKVPSLSVDGRRACAISPTSGRAAVRRRSITVGIARRSPHHLRARSGRGSALDRDHVLVLQYRASFVPAL